MNISRRGMLFETEDSVPIDRRIEIKVNMGDVMGLGNLISLNVEGVTLRQDDRGIAVALRKYRLGPEKESVSERPPESI